MKFVRTEMLFLIWLVPIIFFLFLYSMKKRKKILSNFASSHGQKSIIAGLSDKRRIIKYILLLIVILFIAFSLAGPQYGFKWKEIKQKGVDIIIALDCSKSMLSTDIKPTRLERAKHEIIDLLNMLKGDRVGLVAFSGTAFLQCPLTIDYGAFDIFLDSLNPDYLPVGGSNIADAINTSLSGLNKKDNSQKAIILITDGESTKGDPISAAKKAAKMDVKIFCVGVGKAQGAPIPQKNAGYKKDNSGNIILTKLDEETLKKIAALTDGVYVRSVAGDMDLDTIYNDEIRAKMESSTLKIGKKKIWENRYQWFLLIAILAFIIEMTIPLSKKSSFKTIAILLFFSLFLFNTNLFAQSLNNVLQDGVKSYKDGDYQKALKYFIDAQLKKPDMPEIYYNLGNTYYKLGEFDKALKNFNEVLKTKDKKLKQKTIYNMGNAEFRKGQIEESIKKYKNAVKLDTKDKNAKENLEFAKKKLEQKKKQEQKQCKNKKDKNKKDKDKNKDKNKKNKDKGKQEKQEKNKSKQEKKEQEKKQQQTKKQDMNQRKAQKAKQEKQKSDQDKKDMEKLLNRLQDMPAKPMLPSYHQQNVEKDW